MKTRICDICGSEFQPKVYQHIHCSPKCAKDAEFRNLRKRMNKANDFYDEMMEDPEFRELAKSFQYGR